MKKIYIKPRGYRWTEYILIIDPDRDYYAYQKKCYAKDWHMHTYITRRYKTELLDNKFQIIAFERVLIKKGFIFKGD